MAKFLNTDQLNEWIPRLINEAERELVIIVPYIRTSDRLFMNLFEANKRGVETTIVYRENKLPLQEKEKLAALDNLNLMSHPNIHAKCYYNGSSLIIASMNLYEYSERNNREMGMLLQKQIVEKNRIVGAGDGNEIFEDAVKEINVIINGSDFEKHSRETLTEGFIVDIIKTQKEKTQEHCNKLNKVFIHKRFEPAQNYNGAWISTCNNYFDKLNLTIDYRAILEFTLDETRIEVIFRKTQLHYNEYQFEGFKFYWNHHKDSIYLYKDGRHPMWAEEEEDLIKLKKGIDQLISFLRKFM